MYGHDVLVCIKFLSEKKGGRQDLPMLLQMLFHGLYMELGKTIRPFLRNDWQRL